MRVREYHAFSCQLIRVWCFDFSMILVQTLYIAIAQVIAKNNDDIGIGSWKRRGFAAGKCSKKQEHRHRAV
jgi:hypothetical protein